MNEILGKTVQALRRHKGVTQSQLADILGVSAPAVSKWERGLTMPDITLLAPMARYFGISLDELLSFTATLNQQEAERIYYQCKKAFTAGWNDGIAYCKSQLIQYPCDPILSFLLGGLIQQNLILLTSETEITQANHFIIELYEVAAAASNEYAELANGILIGMYMLDNQLEKAEKQARALPEGMFHRNKSLAPILYQKGETEAAVELYQRDLYYAIHDSTLLLTSLANHAYRQKNWQDALHIYSTMEDLTKLFGLEERFGHLIPYYRAIVYAGMKDEQQTLEQLELFIQQVKSIESPAELSPLLFSRLKLTHKLHEGDIYSTAFKSALSRMIEDTKEFEFIQKLSHYQKLMQQLPQ